MEDHVDCQGESYTDEEHAITDDVPAHLAIRSGKKGVTENGLKCAAGLVLQIE